jgi:tRNA1Val (adenine37-N6)-methyltransferase
LLAWWVEFAPAERILDVGCGVGVVALALARCRGAAAVTGLELQEELVQLARANVAANDAADSVTIVGGDARALPAPLCGAFDVVCANPPFREAGTGRLNPAAGKALARHELTLTLAELTTAAAEALRPGGRFYVIHQPRRLEDLVRATAAAGLHLERLRFVQPRRGEGANLVLAAASRGGVRDVVVGPPLEIYGPAGEYAPEVAALYEGRGRPLYEG